MGYFSNGAEGMDYSARYCERCANYRDNGDGRSHGCPVWDLHLLLNYSEAKLTGEFNLNILDHFIPRTKDGLGNEECEMFLEAGR